MDITFPKQNPSLTSTNPGMLNKRHQDDPIPLSLHFTIDSLLPRLETVRHDIHHDHPALDKLNSMNIQRKELKHQRTNRQ